MTDYTDYDVVIIPGVFRDMKTWEKIKDLHLTGAVYIDVEFNTDTQVYDMAIRHLTIKDI